MDAETLTPRTTIKLFSQLPLQLKQKKNHERICLGLATTYTKAKSRTLLWPFGMLEFHNIMLKSVYFHRKNAENMKKKSALYQMGPYIYTNIISSSFTHGQKKHHACTGIHPSTHACVYIKKSIVGKQAEVEVTSVLSSLKGTYS